MNYIDATTLEPGYKSALYNLGVLYNHHDRLAEAESVLVRLRKHYPDHLNGVQLYLEMSILKCRLRRKCTKLLYRTATVFHHYTILVSNIIDTCIVVVIFSRYTAAPSGLVYFQLLYGGASDGVGDPFMMIIPPIEQFTNNYSIEAFPFFVSNYVTVYVSSEFFQTAQIIIIRQFCSYWLEECCLFKWRDLWLHK